MGVFQVTVPRTGDPVILRCVIQIVLPGEGAQTNKIEMVSTYRNWQLNEAMDLEQFAFELPADAEVMDLDFGSGESGVEPLHPLLGEVAPDTVLTLLDGSTVDLADHLGKDIVILDFWATWCPPCVRALPDLDTLAQEFVGEGVVVYAVNQRETAKQVEEFLTKNELGLTAALDDGSIGELYAVSGIP